MAIYQLKSKKWKAEVWYNQKRIGSKTLKTKAEAEKWKREKLFNHESAINISSSAKDYTYNEIYNYWLANAIPRKTKRSLIKDKQMHRDYISPIIGNNKISDINPTLLTNITLKALEKGLSKSSVNKIIQHFKAVFNEAFTNDLIIKNPSKNIKQFRLHQKEMSYISQQDMDNLISFINSKYVGDQRWIYVIYLTCFLCGCRIGEVLGLEWSHIDFKCDIIKISQMWDSVNHELVKTTKSKKDRFVPLPSILKKEFNELKSKNRGSFIFSHDGRRPIDASNFRNRHWNKDLKSAGIDKKRIHDTRHSYASHFVMNGGSLYDLKVILGHTDFKTTEKYAHFSKEHLARSRDLIKLNISFSDNLSTSCTNESEMDHA